MKKSRFSGNTPESTIVYSLRPGCHSGADWDYCGCSECKERYKPLAFEITTNNMLPYLSPGAKVLTLYAPPETWGLMYGDERVVIKTGDSYLTGRIDAKELTEPLITLNHDNPEYPAEILPKENIDGLWMMSEVLGSAVRYPWPHRFS